MSRGSQDRRAKKRAKQNERVARFVRSVVGTEPTEYEAAVVRAEYRAANEILDHSGVTPAGIVAVGMNAAAYTNTVVADECRKHLIDKCACSTGCAWCCVLEISAFPTEVLQLAAWIASRRTSEEVTELVSRLRTCVETRDAENAAGRAPRVYCPLLASDRTCSVYEVRPASCAAALAPDAEPCKRYTKGGDDAAEGLVIIPAIHAPAEVAARVVADRGGPAFANNDAKVDLHTGLATALAAGVEDVASRWLSGGEVFAEARDRFVRRRELLATLDSR